MTVELTTLSNGFRIVTEAMPGLHSASLGVWVTAGGRHERAEENGIAHFLEHMAFKGTTRRSALEIAEAIENVGGYLNAYTSRETTAYYARVLAADVELALDVIADIVLNPVFDAGEIEVERGVILQEIGQVNDTPDDLVFDLLQEVAYPGQPMGRPILGDAARVRDFARSDLERFVREHYLPGEMILAAAGAVDHARLVALAEALFGGLDPRRPAPAEPARFAIGEWREAKPLEQVHLALAFEAPGYRDDEIYTAQVYSTAMGGGMSSRLFQEIRERRGLCYSIFAQSGAYADTGMTTIYAGTSAEDIGALVEITADEMRRAAEEMSHAEVERARAQLKAGLLMGLESPSARAERLARMLAIWGRVPSISETIGKIEAVGRDHVRGFAARTTAAPAALALIGPAAGAPDLAGLRERLAA